MDKGKVMDYGSEEFVSMYKDRVSRVLNVAMVQHIALQYMGDLEGKTVVEFGCGIGNFIEKCLHNGAKLCLGMDINPTMMAIGGNIPIDELEYGKKWENDEGVQSCFLVKDCFKPLNGLNCYGQFDFAIFHHFLNECKNEEELGALFKNAYDLLKSKGKLNIGQFPFMVNTLKDQETLLDLCGIKWPMKSQVSGKEPFFGDAPVFSPAPACVSKTGRPYTRKLVFTFNIYMWSISTLMEKLKAVGFVNVHQLPLAFPDNVPLHERKQVESLEEPFILIGAEKP